MRVQDRLQEVFADEPFAAAFAVRRHFRRVLALVTALQECEDHRVSGETAVGSTPQEGPAQPAREGQLGGGLEVAFWRPSSPDAESRAQLLFAP